MTEPKLYKVPKAKQGTWLCDLCLQPLFYYYQREDHHRFHPDSRECAEALGLAVLKLSKRVKRLELLNGIKG